MSTTVDITLGDDGKLYVGLEESGEAAEDTSNMQPAASLDEALKMAGHLLQTSGGAGGTQPGGQPSGAPADQSGAGDQSQAPADAGASQPDAKAMWDEMAANQQTPPH